MAEKNLDQTFRIKRLLAERRETITSMARKLDVPFGTVANNVYGYRRNSEVQHLIAGFLDRPAQQIFVSGAPAGREGGEGLQAQHA